MQQVAIYSDRDKRNAKKRELPDDLKERVRQIEENKRGR